MKAQIVDFKYLSPRKCHLTLELDGDFTGDYVRLKNSDVDVSIKKWHPARSKNANSYAWFLIDRIAESTREAPTEVYRRYIRDVGCKESIVCVKVEDMQKEIDTFLSGHKGRMVDIADSKIPGCVVLHKKYGSSDYDSKQMAALIDNIYQDCEILGIEKKDKSEIDKMIKDWR